MHLEGMERETCVMGASRGDGGETCVMGASRGDGGETCVMGASRGDRERDMCDGCI